MSYPGCAGDDLVSSVRIQPIIVYGLSEVMSAEVEKFYMKDIQNLSITNEPYWSIFRYVK
jgi:hypothetical protein